MDTVRRSHFVRTLRQIGGGVTHFTGQTKMFFRAADRQAVVHKLTALFGAPLSDKPGKSVWWCEELKVHFKLVTFRHDTVVIIPSVADEVKGTFE